jgi:3-hydroxybutyryl-CoA dehydrogenase
VGTAEAYQLAFRAAEEHFGRVVMAIERVGVVGFGAMGSGIAQVCAMAGFPVAVREVDQAAIDRGWRGVDGSLARVVKAGRMSEDDAKAARARMTASTSLTDLGASDLVIEAVLEIADVKRKVFEELDGLCGPTTIFCSNTSSLPIVDMAIRTKRPDRFAGLHFFNPAPVMQLVEVVSALTTSDETIEILRAFVRKLGKTPVVSKDVAGFIVNRLLVPYMLDAIRVLEQGVASADDIDTAVKLGLRHPMGPFELLDYTGLDISLHVGDVFFEEFREPRMAPPPLLRRMVAAGHLGRKSGRGFYDYDEKGTRKR